MTKPTWACPRCGSYTTKSVSVTDPNWTLNGQRCLTCGFQGHFTLFDPDLDSGGKRYINDFYVNLYSTETVSISGYGIEERGRETDGSVR